MAPRRNIEFKAINPDPPRSVLACIELGATDEGELRQTDTYFCVPNGRLKLREENHDLAWLIFYERSDAAKPRESRYRLIEVADPAGLKAALSSALGVSVVVEKRRRLFLWDNVRVHLDHVPGLGDFVELEAVASGASDLTPEYRAVETVRAALAITDDHIVTWGYADRLLATARQDEASLASPA
jgi:adenylate cyclase class IV